MRDVYLVFVLFFSCFFLSSISQSQTITIGGISPTTYCAGTSISIPFSVSAAFGNGNVFIAQLSNASGSFVSPTQIGLLSTDTSGILTGTITSTVSFGNAYKIRIISSSPIDTSNNSVALTINPLPANAGTITGTATVCQGQNSFTYKVAVINNALSYLWTLPSGASGTSTVDSIVVSYSLTAVSGNIIVKGNNACGDGISSNLMLVVNPTPDVPTALSSVSFCQNSPATPLIVSGSNLLWYTASTGGIGSNMAPILSTSITGTTNYYVTQTNSFGCESARKQIDVIINTLPIANFSFSPITAQCSGSSISFTNSSSNATNYNWRFGDRLTASIASPIHIFDTIGNGSNIFSIWLIAISQYACKDSISHPITVIQRPDPSLKSDGSGGFENSPPIGTPSVLKKCALLPPNTLALTNIFSPIPTYSTLTSDSIYDITFGTGTPSNWTGSAFTPLPHDFPLGSYTLIYKVTGKNKCISTRQYQVYAGTNPGGGINLPPGTTMQCAPQTYNFPLSNNVFNNTPSTQYTLSFNDGTPDVIYDQSQMQSSPFFYDVVDATWKYPHTFNTGSCGKLSTLYTNSFYVKLRINNACAEAPSEAQPIVLLSKPSAGFSFSSGPYCVSPSNLILTDTSMGTCNIYYDAAVAGKYVSFASLNRNWTITPSTYQIVSGTLTSTPLTIRFLQAGNYTIKYVSSGNNQCGNDSVTKTICVSPIPIPGFTINKNTFCLPDTVKITDTTNTSFFCSTPIYTWNISCINNVCDGSNCNTGYSYINSTTSSSKNPEIKFTKPGIYSLSLTVNNACAIITSSIQTITVKDKPIANFNLPLSVCMNASICPSAVMVANCYSSSSLSYLWSSVLGPFTNPASQTPGCVLASSVGIQTVTLTIANECGLTTVNKSLTVNPLPVVNQLSNIIVCPGDNIPTQTFSSIPSGASYSWTNSNVNIGKPSSGNGNIISWVAPINSSGVNVVGTITVTPTLAGCPGTSMIFSVTIKPSPLSNPLSNLNFCPGDSIPLQSFTSNPSGASFTWTNSNIGIGIGSSGSVNIPPWIAPSNNGSLNISGNISVTPSLNSCIGNAMSYTINIYPTPTVNPINNISVCPGSSVSIGNFMSTPPGATFSWTNTNTAIGLASSGNGNITNWIALDNTSGSDYTATITVTPLLNGCSGTPRNFTITVKSKPVLTAMLNQTICSGQSTTAVSLNSNISGTSFNWSSSVSGSLTPVPGSGISNPIPASIFVNNNSTLALITYTITPTSNLCVGSSANYTVTVNPAPIFVTQPTSSTVCLGGNPTQLEVSYTNSTATPTYQWYSNTINNTSSGSLIGGATTSTYSPSASIAGIVYYYCILTFPSGGCANITSNTAMVDVKADPAISIQPTASQSICVGGILPTALTVSYSAGTGTPTYQWYSNNTSSTTGGTIIPSAINASYIPPTFNSTGNYYYYLTINLSGSGCDATTSNIAMVTIVADPVIDTQAVVTQSLCQNAVPDNLHISVIGGVGSVLYQWYSNTINNNTGGSLISGATAASYTPLTTMIGTKYYYCVVTQTAAGCSVVSAVSAVVINSAPIIVTQPSSSSVCVGGIPTQLTVNYTNGNGSPAYQWYSNTINNTTSGSSIGGATTSTFNPPATTAGVTYYYCILTFSTGGCANITSNTAIVDVKADPAINIQPTVSQSICVGGVLPTSLSVNYTAGTGTPTYQWYSNTTSTTSGGTIIAAAINASYIPPTFITIGNYYYYLTINLSGSGCDATTSNIALVSVVADPVIDTQALVTQSLCQNAVPANLHISVSGGAGTIFYQWYSNTINSNSGGSLISGSTSATYAPSTTTVGTKYYYCIVTQSVAACMVVSAVSTLVVNSAPLFTLQPYSSDTCQGFIFAPISVNYSNGTGLPSYQWYSNLLNTTLGATPIAAATTNTFTPPSNTTGTVYYYCVISFSSGGCSNITSNVVAKIVYPKPIAAYAYTPVSGGQPLNVSFTNLSTTQPLSNLWTFGNGFPNLTNQNPVVLLTNTGVIDSLYSIRLIVTSTSGCKDTVVHTVNVHPLPITKFGAPNVCFGLATQFSDSSLNTIGIINNWHWNFGDGDTSNLQNPAHYYLNAGTYSVSLTTTNNLNISNTFTKNIIVYPLPVPNFTTTYDTLGCVSPATVSFTNTSTGAQTYKWNFGDNSTATTFNTSHIYVTTGYYFVKLFDTTQFKCVDSIQHRIRVISSPVANSHLSVSDSCGPLSVTFTNQSTGLYLSYLWNFNIGTPSTSVLPGPFTKVYPAGANDSIFYVSLKATNICGFKFYYDTITVFSKPKCDFGMTQNWGCSPLTISFLDTIVGHPDSLLWNFGDGSPKIHSSVFSQNIFHTFTYSGADDTTYNIKLIAYNKCGSDTIIKSLIVYRNTANAFFNTDTLFGCKPLTVHFTNCSQGATHYKWSFGDGNFSNQPTIAHTYSQPGVYIAYLAVDNDCSKDTFWSNPITVYPSPIVGFIYSGNHCTYDSVSFTSVTPGLSQYSWNFGDGGQSNLYNPKHKFNNYGNFAVKLIGYTINGCRDTSTQMINIQFTPTSKMNIIKRTDCSPLTTNIVNQTDNLNLNNYNWTIGNGNTYVSTQPPTQTFVNSSFCNDNFIPITLVSEYSGCYDTITDSVRVLPIPLSKFSLQDSCDFGFNSLVQTVNQSVCASAYTWKLNGSQVSVQTNPIIPIPNPGYFAIQQIASNLFQCKDTSEIVFHLFQSPFASIIMDTNNICEPFPATPINFSANIDSIQYLWSFGDGVIAIGQNVNHIYNQAGNYTVHVNISGMGGCLDSIQLTNIVHIHPRAKAKFSFLNNSMPYPDLWRVHFTNTSINSSIWNWTFGDGNSSTDENPSHSYPRKDSYLVTLAVNNSFNCPDDTAMWIQLNELWGLFIPSAFSPGNINPDIAYFKAYGDGLLEFNLEVYDTWGNKLWATSEILDKKPVGYWDGTVNGKPMPSDTYVWKVSARFIDGNPWFGMKQADGKYKTYGTITLIR